MNACLDTLFIELYQVNIGVGRIAQRQAVMGGFVFETSLPPTPEAFEAENEDDDDDDDDAAIASEDDDDGDASSSNTDEMSTWHFYLLSLVTKMGVVLDIRVVILKGRVSIRPFC